MFYIAFLNAYNDPFNPVAHKSNAAFFSEDVTFGESENGDAAIVPYFKLTVHNPGAAWLASQPSRYAVLSEMYGDATQPVELMRGRMDLLPSELAGDECDINFRCLPPSEDDVLQDAADDLRVGEDSAYDPDDTPEAREKYEAYDPLFYGENASDDPGTALMGSLDVWRWNRVTLIPERVNLITGAVQHLIAGRTAGFHGSDKIRISNPPKAISRLRLTAQWTQATAGQQTSEFLSAQDVTSYSWQSLLDNFPKPGDAIGNANGWTIAQARIEAITNMFPITYGHPVSSVSDATAFQVTLQPKRITMGLRAGFSYSQPREEYLDLYMHAGVQQILDEDKTETVDQLTLGNLTIDVTTKQWIYEDPQTLEVTHYNVGDEVQAAGRAWVCLIEHDAQPQFSMNLFNNDGSVAEQLWQQITKNIAVDGRAPNYWDTRRGIRSVRHGLRRLERVVQRRARAAEISFDVDWLTGRFITCADECLIENRRWPGGQAIGKVIAVQANGRKRTVTITVGVSVGTGVAPADKTDDQQQTGDIVYDWTADAINAPVDAYALQGMSPTFVIIENEEPAQRAIAEAAVIGGQSPMAVIAQFQTRVRIAFPSLREETLITRRMSATTTNILVRKGIDLTPES